MWRRHWLLQEVELGFLLVEKSNCLGGAAMAPAVKNKASVREINVGELQAVLTKNGAYIGIEMAT